MADLARAKPASRIRGKAKLTSGRSAPPSGVINLRASAETRALIDRAAAACGQNRTEFMLNSARTHAEDVLLNQVYFSLGEENWAALAETLAVPPPANAELRSALRRTPLWERK